MFTNRRALINVGVTGTFAFLSCCVSAQVFDFTGGTTPQPTSRATKDGKPDILWRRRSRADTYIWQMDRLSLVSVSPNVGNTGNDPNWKVVGAGDFNGDGETDILWQHETQDQIGIWYLSGPTLSSSASISVAPGLVWRIVGVGDFGSAPTIGAPSNVQDGKPDIVLQNKDTGQVAIWLMNNTELRAGVVLPDADSLGAGRKIVAVGEFGTSPTDARRDGRPDIVIANFNTGSLVVRYMNGYTKVVDVDVYNPVSKKSFTFEHDKDLQVVGAGDYTQDQNDDNPNNFARTDLLVRHATDGRVFVWRMEGKDFQKDSVLQLNTWDTDWRVATQDLAESTWRVTGQYLSAKLAATGISSTRMDITFIDFPTGGTVMVRRRVSGTTPWTLIASGVKGRVYQDQQVVAGTTYDYQGQYRDINGSSGVMIQLNKSTVEQPPLEDRGRVLLVVEQGLASDTRFVTDLATFTRNLVSDGWTVVRKPENTPRHQDPNWTAENANNVRLLKSWIKHEYDLFPSTTKSVVLLGHVPVPYSGNCPDDGHADHAVEWAADAYYGDVSGPAWTDSGNGAFTDNIIPSLLELAVGRIDFARLPAFGVPDNSDTTAAEAALVAQYLRKDDNYRNKRAPYPLPDRMMLTYYDPVTWSGHVDNGRDTMSILYGQYTGRIMVGEPFRNNATYRTSVPSDVPCLWASTGGGGNLNQIYNVSLGGLMFTTTMLAGSSESPIAFWEIEGSYFADFNVLDNLPRAILAKPSYSLVVIPYSIRTTPPPTFNEPLGFGEHIGAAFVNSVNLAVGTRECGSPVAVRNRWRNLQGDPTLRVNVVSPPTITNTSRHGSTVSLTWSAGESDSVYHIYRAATSDGPFTKVTMSGPINGLTRNDITDDPAARVYMVRGIKITPTGRGSYWNLSQGSLTTVP